MKTDFTEGSVGRKMVFFSLPIIFGMFLHTAYNIIDAIFIGMLGAEEFAAVSLAFPVVFIFIAIASGLGVGANALLSQAIGRKNLMEANNIAEHSLIFSVVLAVLIAFLGILFSPQIFSFMGADETVLGMTVEYANIIFIGLIAMFVWFISEAILRAQGNSKTPMKSLLVSVVLNIILDPIMIFGLFGFPAMGLVGAGIATVIARTVAAVINFAYIYTPKSSIDLALRAFKPNMDCIKGIVFIGLPASAAQTLTAAGFILLTSIVGGFGTYAIAALGIGMRLHSIIAMPIIGIASAVITVVGQNIGVNEIWRVKRATKHALKVTLPFSALVVIVLFLIPEVFLRIFTQDAKVIEIGLVFLAIVPISYLFQSIHFTVLGTFQGAGRTDLAFIANGLHWFSVIVIAYLLSQSMGLVGVWYALVIGGAIELVVVMGIYFSGIWLNEKKDLQMQRN